MKDDLKTPSLPSVPRALEVLDHIASSQNGLTLTQLTRTLGFPRSTVHCLLLTLRRAGYIQQVSPRGPFTCGGKLLELSSKALAGSNLREIAKPILRSLVQRTRRTAHIAVLERNQVTIIAQVSATGSNQVTSVGQRLEIHCTALGKAIAAHLPESKVIEILKGRVLTPHNERTIVSHRRLTEELAVSRQRGYAIDDEEDAIGFRCLAAPVLDAAEEPVAAISVMGTTMEITDANAPSMVAELKRAAKRISEELRSADHGEISAQSA